MTTGQLIWVPKLREAMELASACCVEFGHHYIGTEHILLGLLLVPESIAVAVLEAQKVDVSALKSELRQMLESCRTRPEPATDSQLYNAAPELLAACRIALMAAQNNLQAASYKNEHALLEAFNACKAAIAKATGDAS